MAQNDVGLIPWVPLTAHAGPAEELLKECRARIDRDAPKDRHEGLLAVTSILAKTVYDKGLVTRLILGGSKMIDLMEFPDIRELVEERAHSTAVDYIAGILKARFPSVPDDLRTRLDAVTDESRLAALRDIAATCPDLEAFRVALVGN